MFLPPVLKWDDISVFSGNVFTRFAVLVDGILCRSVRKRFAIAATILFSAMNDSFRVSGRYGSFNTIVADGIAFWLLEKVILNEECREFITPLTICTPRLLLPN